MLIRWETGTGALDLKPWQHYKNKMADESSVGLILCDSTDVFNILNQACKSYLQFFHFKNFLKLQFSFCYKFFGVEPNLAIVNCH